MSEETDLQEERGDAARARIVVATAALIASGGLEAATTRAIAEAAAVQAPTIYRLFGDKRGLLDAVALKTVTDYVAGKAARAPHPDPVQDLRDGWDAHVAFALAHPQISCDHSGANRSAAGSSAAAAGLDVLRRRIRRIALAGRLKVSEARAVSLLVSVAAGVILTLLDRPESARDPGFCDLARETVVAAIVSETTVVALPGPHGAATALLAGLDGVAVLTQAERHLLSEWLERIAAAG